MEGKTLMDLRTIDMHVHTYFSDGTFSPEEVVAYAKKTGLSAIAISDHDCVDALPRAIRAGKASGLEIIPAVELSSEQDGREVHVLGYGIDCRNIRFKRILVGWRKDRLSRAKKILIRLAAVGITLKFDKVKGIATKSITGEVSPFKMVGRLHIARALVEAGFVLNVREAFERYLKEGRPGYVKKYPLNPIEAFRVIHDAGGLAVLAHPGVFSKDEYISKWSKQGLDGVEAYHPNHSPQKSEHYVRIARRHHLIITGGSDCHGLAKGSVLMGKVMMPYETLEKLRQKNFKIHKSNSEVYHLG